MVLNKKARGGTGFRWKGTAPEPFPPDGRASIFRRARYVAAGEVRT